MANPRQSAIGSWGELFGRHHAGALTVLAGGVAIYAVNAFMTMSLLPSVVVDIGGERLYAWVTTVYLVASVVAATTVGSLVLRFGPRSSYLGAFACFAVGSALCTLAPTMPLLLVGRCLQGLAGGLLAGLGYTVINLALPEQLWVKSVAVVSAMWGVGTLVGPAAGGLLAQYLTWRAGFGLLTVLALAMGLLVPVALPAKGKLVGAVSSTSRIPVWSVLFLGFAALAVSAAAASNNLTATMVLIASGAVLVVLFLVVDQRTTAPVLPRSVFQPGPLKWVYLALGILMAAAMADIYIPLFGQRLAGLTPVAAGFLGAMLSVGWTLAEIGSASIPDNRVIVRVVAVAPLVMASGFVIAMATQRQEAPTGVVAVWVLAYLLAGCGIGMAWPHLSAWAMGAVADPAEQAVAAAAINIVQTICGAFGAGLAGLVVNLRAVPDAAASRSMFGVFAVAAATCCVASYRSSRLSR